MLYSITLTSYQHFSQKLEIAKIAKKSFFVQIVSIRYPPILVKDHLHWQGF
jgi:hypothetical protein